jgi:flagellar hook-associated protein 3 FlgL
MLIMTENTIYTAQINDIQAAQRRTFTAQQRASSGLRVMTADDDPTAAARGSLLNAAIGSIRAMGRVADIATSQLDTADKSMGEAQAMLSRARELAVMGANEPLSPDERKHIAAEVHVLHDSMVALANTQVGGTYIFAGAGAAAPFAADGTYSGDSGVRQLDVAPGVRISANVPGSAVFNVTGGENIIGMLEDLATSLEGDEVQKIYDAIETLDRAIDQVNTARSEVGGQMVQLNLAETQRTETDILLKRDRSDSLEVDQSEALVRMIEANTAYQTALAAASHILAQLQNNRLMS